MDRNPSSPVYRSHGRKRRCGWAHRHLMIAWLFDSMSRGRINPRADWSYVTRNLTTWENEHNTRDQQRCRTTTLSFSQFSTFHCPQRYAKLFPFLQSRADISMSEQDCNSSSYREYITNDVKHKRKQPCTLVANYANKSLCLVILSSEHIHAHPSIHTRPHSHTVWGTRIKLTGFRFVLITSLRYTGYEWTSIVHHQTIKTIHTLLDQGVLIYHPLSLSLSALLIAPVPTLMPITLNNVPPTSRLCLCHIHEGDKLRKTGQSCDYKQRIVAHWWCGWHLKHTHLQVRPPSEVTDYTSMHTCTHTRAFLRWDNDPLWLRHAHWDQDKETLSVAN